ncbi:paraquat-inducible protein A [Kistimonas asteriae]|uniref:paraquat-inducible protein A n=1 Tax=Kistimonas asteriae TaxID=517724 RepID=UPI001BADF0F1|nr:paraquat-inducible protein A [Kistimonas asteriae]
MTTGKRLGLQQCLECHEVCHCDLRHCPRCGATVYIRRRNSIQRTWALLITAAILFIPANLLPIMTVSQFGKGTPDTIMSGVIELMRHDMVPIALLVFTASILVPMFKLIGMVILLLAVRKGKPAQIRRHIQLYRFIEWIGRWSMLDIFMISILVALVSFGRLGTIEAGPGAVAFSSVVVLTMLAAISFDPRLLWDAIEPPAHSKLSQAAVSTTDDK